MSPEESSPRPDAGADTVPRGDLHAAPGPGFPASGAGSIFGLREAEAPEPAVGLEPGKLVNDYRLVELIGQGGMGQVWKAEQVSLGGREVAIKFLRSGVLTQRDIAYLANPS